MAYLFKLFLITCLGLVACTNAVAGQNADVSENAAPLIFGLLPSESIVAKFKRYAPLREYLSRKLNRQVVLETAANFPEFVKRTRVRRYDFLETAPHFVPPAIDSAQYEVLTTIVQPLSVQVVVHKNSHYQDIAELAGKQIATPSPKAIVTKIGKELLERKGLIGSKQARFKTFKTHNAAYQAVVGGQADAAMISVNIYNKAIYKQHPIRSIASSYRFPNMSILAATNLPENLRESIQNILAGMIIDKEGRKVLKAISYPGYRKAGKEEFDVLRKYIN
jgi:phosphonate transport system substrate-binding protein